MENIKKMLKNLKKFQQSEKTIFFFNLKVCKYIFFAKEEKNAILVVLLFEEISLRPELSNPPVWNLRWIHHKRDGAGAGVGQAWFLIGYLCIYEFIFHFVHSKAHCFMSLLSDVHTIFNIVHPNNKISDH